MLLLYLSILLTITCMMWCPCFAPRAAQAQAPAESRFLLHANIFSWGFWFLFLNEDRCNPKLAVWGSLHPSKSIPVKDPRAILCDVTARAAGGRFGWETCSRTCCHSPNSAGELAWKVVQGIVVQVQAFPLLCLGAGGGGGAGIKSQNACWNVDLCPRSGHLGRWGLWSGW